VAWMSSPRCVRGELPIWRLVRSGRGPLGLAVQVSAQSWEGPGRGRRMRRQAGGRRTAEGGILAAGRTAQAVTGGGTGREPCRRWTRRGGTQATGAWGDDGLFADPGARRCSTVTMVRARLERWGQVCYVYRGRGVVTFLQIKRLTGRQPAIGQGLAVGNACGVPSRPQCRCPSSSRPSRLRERRPVSIAAFPCRPGNLPGQRPVSGHLGGAAWPVAHAARRQARCSERWPSVERP